MSADRRQLPVLNDRQAQLAALRPGDEPAGDRQDRGMTAPQRKPASEAAVGVAADLPEPLRSLCIRGRALWRGGQLAESAEQLEQACRLARELDHQPGRVAGPDGAHAHHHRIAAARSRRAHVPPTRPRGT
jgi:hypothetical protein